MGRPDGSRCGIGLIAEKVYGFTFVKNFDLLADGAYLTLDREAFQKLKELIGDTFYTNVVYANDHLGKSFDEIAKMVKGWPETKLITGRSYWFQVTHSQVWTKPTNIIKL